MTSIPEHLQKRYRMYFMANWWTVDTGDGTQKFRFKKIRSAKGIVFRTMQREAGVTFPASEPPWWIELINVRMTVMETELFVSD